MRICVLADGYPSDGRLEFVFVKQLCEELSRQGHNITVIAPQSFTKRILRHLPKVPFYSQEAVNGTPNKIDVYRPSYFSLSNLGNKFFFIRWFHKRSYNKTLKKLPYKPDVIYGHFWHSAFSGYKYAAKEKIPLFVASGEAEIEQRVRTKRDRKIVGYISGVICVSTKNRDESINKKLTDGDNCIIIPNAIDNNIFKILDRKRSRELLQLSEKDFVVVFVGGFIHRKGPDRVSKAIERLQNENIKSIFIGGNRDSTNITPNCRGIIFCGRVEHDEIPKYLNAADVFVLPTLHEGCCNAIVEAMACGLPIISSDLAFNYDILDNSNAILVDPHSENQIAQAIDKLYKEEQYRNFLGQNSLSKAKELRISSRATKIIKFIEEKLNQ